MIPVPAASPSRPSVRFAPLAAPGDDQKEERVVGVGERDVDVQDRHVDRGVELILRVHRDAHDNRDPGEEDELPPTLEPERAAMAKLDVVVEEADRATGDGQEENGQCRQREAREREEGKQCAEQDQQAAHHRCPLLDAVTGRAFLADLLAELVPAQELDELRADHDRDHHRDQARYEDSGH